MTVISFMANGIWIAIVSDLKPGKLPRAQIEELQKVINKHRVVLKVHPSGNVHPLKDNVGIHNTLSVTSC